MLIVKMNQWERGPNGLNCRKHWILGQKDERRTSCPNPYILQTRNVKPPKVLAVSLWSHARALQW